MSLISKSVGFYKGFNWKTRLITLFVLASVPITILPLFNRANFALENMLHVVKAGHVAMWYVLLIAMPAFFTLILFLVVVIILFVFEWYAMVVRMKPRSALVFNRLVILGIAVCFFSVVILPSWLKWMLNIPSH